MSYSSFFYHGPGMKTNSKFLHLSMAAFTTFRAFPCVGRAPRSTGSEPGRMISCGSTTNWRLAANAGTKLLPNLWVSKNRGKTPKMDAENNGKPY